MLINPGKSLLYNMCLLFLLSTLVFAKSYGQTTVTGRITDSGNIPLPFVSVLLLLDSTFVAGTSTDESGRFSVLISLQTGGSYSFRFSAVGYQPLSRILRFPDTAFLQHIILLPDKHALDAVTVNAKKPLVTRKTDRYIVNVENSYLADGYSGLQVLQQSPGIWVDNNGSIRIKGSQPAVVMINDVIQRMSGDELADFLRTLKSEDISRIEIINNPPSEYEAAGPGGIIHILLKKNRKDGWSAAANAQYRYQGLRPMISGGSSLQYKNRKWLFTGGYSFTNDDRDITERSDISYPGNQFYANITNRKERVRSRQYRLGLTYDIAPGHSIDLQSVRTRNMFPQLYTSGITIISPGQHTTGTTVSDKDRRMQYGSVTLNYTWRLDTLGSMVKVIGDYSYSDKNEISDFLEQYSDPSLDEHYRFGLPFTTAVHSIQADYTKLFKQKVEWKAGVKYASIRRDNTIAAENYLAGGWVPDSGQSNRFVYTENLLMFYSSLEKSFGKLTIKTGLRAEETFSTGHSVTAGQRFKRNYFGLFPSVFIVRHFKNEQGASVYLSYSRRLNRPALRDLNPYRILFSNYTALTGNPGLLPEYTHNITAGYTFLVHYSAELYVTRTENVITMSANPGPNHSIDYFSENVNNSLEYGLSISAPFTLARVWNISNSASLFHLSYRFSGQKTRQTSFSFRSIHALQLSKTVEVDAMIDYRSPYVYSNLYNPQAFFVDLGCSKKILRGRGKVRLTVSDVFNTLREKEITDDGQTRIVFFRKRQTRGAGISFTYSFHAGKKFSQKQIQQGSGEERSRVGG